MSRDKLDMILDEIYSEPVYPSEKLVKSTQMALKRQGHLRYVIVFSMALSIVAAFIFTYFILLGLNSILGKITLFVIVSIVQNAIILIIYLYKEDVSDIFMQMQANLT